MRTSLAHCQTGHAGLLLERLVPDLSDAARKPELIKELIGKVEGWDGQPVYRDAYGLFRARLEALPRIVVAELPVADRVVVGLGTENPMETSITLNRLYGVPMIPGSALKGVAKAFARLYKPDADTRDFDRQTEFLFGTTEGGGRVTFFDAWWVPGKAPLRKDVITVHHQPYYTSKGKEAPTDFDDPNPVSFVSARGSFLFAVQGPTLEWSQLAMGLLKGGLLHLGVGAKTSSGYGRFWDKQAAAGPVTGPGGQPAQKTAAVDPSTLTDDQLENAIRRLLRESLREYLPRFAERWHTIKSGHTKRAVGLAIQAMSKTSGVSGPWMSPINNFLQKK